MASSIEQVIKALAGLIPEDALKTTEEAISQFLENAVKELDKEYSEKLEEAYKTISEERVTDEATAEAGYAQAWEIITDLRDRLEIQKEEFEQALEEGYEEAYQMIQVERAKNDTLEVSLYEEYDKRMSDVKEFMVDKIDQFLALQGEKYYEMAKKDLVNDPTVSEQRQAFDKILEVAQNFLSDEDFACATSGRIEQLAKQLDENKVHIKTLEAKNMRLATQNQQLTEAVKHQHNVLTESKNNERTVRTQKAKNAEGRGKGNLDRQVVIGEQKDVTPGETVSEQQTVSDDRSQKFSENLGEDIFADWKYLSNIDKDVNQLEEQVRLERKRLEQRASK
jgi:hypothetical protein